MKLWEVLKALDENPKKVFSCASMRVAVVSGAYKFTNVNTRKVEFWMGKDNDWQEVKTHVTWMEALGAWALEGKTIRCKIDDLDFIYKHETTTYGGDVLLESDGEPLEIDEIKHGTWYIED